MMMMMMRNDVPGERGGKKNSEKNWPFQEMR